MPAHLTAAQARALGIAATGAVPARKQATRKAAPRAGTVTVCHVCGERFTGETGEARHTVTARHYRYDWLPFASMTDTDPTPPDGTELSDDPDVIELPDPADADADE